MRMFALSFNFLGYVSHENYKECVSLRGECHAWVEDTFKNLWTKNAFSSFGRIDTRFSLFIPISFCRVTRMSRSQKSFVIRKKAKSSSLIDGRFMLSRTLRCLPTVVNLRCLNRGFRETGRRLCSRRPRLVGFCISFHRVLYYAV